MEEETVSSLREKLGQYVEQLQMVEAVLEDDPDNDEYIQIQQDLKEVITMTQDLLRLKLDEQQKSIPSTSTSTTPVSPPPLTPHLPTTTLMNSPTFFSVGTICEARYSADNVWYQAKIEEILEGGRYRVHYVAYGNKEDVSITDIRPLSDLAKQSKNAPLKRPIVPDAIQQIPKSLQIQPTDTEEERAHKKKKVHAIKSANRLKVADEERNSVKNNWVTFQTKTKKKVPMSLTSKKKGSIFASPDTVEGKVGVTNSGKPMTQLTGYVEPKDMIKIVGTKKNVFMPNEEDEQDN